MTPVWLSKYGAAAADDTWVEAADVQVAAATLQAAGVLEVAGTLQAAGVREAAGTLQVVGVREAVGQVLVVPVLVVLALFVPVSLPAAAVAGYDPIAGPRAVRSLPAPRLALSRPRRPQHGLARLL